MKSRMASLLKMLDLWDARTACLSCSALGKPGLLNSAAQ